MVAKVDNSFFLPIPLTVENKELNCFKLKQMFIEWSLFKYLYSSLLFIKFLILLSLRSLQQ